MFTVKNKKLLPYQILLFGALGLYLYKLHKAANLAGQMKVKIDTDKLSRAAMPFIPVSPNAAPMMQEGLKKGLDIIFARIKK